MAKYRKKHQYSEDGDRSDDPNGIFADLGLPKYENWVREYLMKRLRPASSAKARAAMYDLWYCNMVRAALGIRQSMLLAPELMPAEWDDLR